MIKFSQNKKTNGVLNGIYEDLLDLGLGEVKRYYNEFKGQEVDYNLAQYGNLLIYHDEVREFYKKYGYTTTIDKMSDQKLWNTYKRQVGYVTRYIVHSTTI